MKQLLLAIVIAASLIGFNACESKNTSQKESSQNESSPNYYNDMENQLKIIAEITLKPDAASSMKPIFEKVIAGSQAEEGCIYYDLHKVDGDTTNTKYVMLETWKNQAAIDTHNQAQHFKTFKQASSDYIEAMRITTVKISN